MPPPLRPLTPGGDRLKKAASSSALATGGGGVLAGRHEAARYAIKEELGRGATGQVRERGEGGGGAMVVVGGLH